ncbi:putative ribosome-binding factor A, chloroplastic [Apostasia shenzhenica]|uniref:Putative ribosome-binding factor A, chloroplastic n=1 Tax=Apostasia shenzhenica TaxID=1088818 RepID=A0A2I0A446_9ASPA|nr:putative ribosome-binding factor A, chloroplastic [Apostasia shenzhenica]
MPPPPCLCRLQASPSPPLLITSSSSSSTGRLSLYGNGRRSLSRSPAAAVRCMANQRRVKMVAKQIRRELSDMLLTDNVLRYAVLPEASLGADRYLSSLTTISDVEVSGDLQVVKVYVSVFGDERGREVAITGLKSKAKYVRSELGRRMKLRLTPEIRFIEDDSLERGSRVIAILDRLKSERENSERYVAEQPEHSASSGQNVGLDEDDQDEGIIYVN